MTNGRTIAIGDVHGCSQALAVLIEAFAPKAEDLVIFLGDLIDRGPDSSDVIEQILRLRNQCRVVTLMGNHEAMFLNAAQAFPGSPEWDFWVGNGGHETLASYHG
ncbi:MAG: metallophosphoesterase, partial [Planctomycetales bacterium]